VTTSLGNLNLDTAQCTLETNRARIEAHPERALASLHLPMHADVYHGLASEVDECHRHYAPAGLEQP
jgi:hypothetical protein